MTAGTLTGIFSPGSPALLESLRTLVVTPARDVEPGAIVRTDFTFSNAGGAPATGVRARFALPAGVTHLSGSDAIDDAPLPAGESFISINGASIGDLEPNASRRISASFRVNDLIEDGTVVAFQAALVSDQLPVTASNIERATVRSMPNLQNSSTLVTIIAGDEPNPGDHLTIRATIFNSGPSSAHDVIAILPVPEHTTFVPRTARIAGRPVSDGEGEPFDFDSATIVASRLAPAQSVVVEYQAAVESPLADGTRIRASGAVSSAETSEFAVKSSEIVVRSPIDFGDDETGMTVFSDDSVTPGTRIAMSLRASNHGSGPAQNVSALFDLPPGLIYTQGSLTIDGQPIGDEALAAGSIALGTIAPGRSVEVGIAAMVGVPPEGDYPLPIVSYLRWKGASNGAQGERQFQRRLTVRATARFSRARNFIEVGRRIAQGEEDVDFFVHLLNDGTAADRHSQLRVLPGAFIGGLRIVDEAGLETPYDSPVKLDALEPHAERIVTVRAKIIPPVPDRSTVTLGAVLEQPDRTVDLGVGSVVVRSRAHISPAGCGWELQSSEPLRPGRTAEVIIRFSNEGSDTLRDAHAVLEVPPEISLERAHDARREHTTLYFGDVAAKSTHEARVTLRLLRARSGDDRLHLGATLYGRGMSAVAFKPIEIATHSQADFEPGARLHSTPYESVNTGERISYDLQLRNSGDGPALQLVVRAIPSNLAVYVPGSTTVNGAIVTDDVGASALWSQRGLLLTEIDPGVQVRVHWEMIAVSPLESGTPIDARVVLNWDGDRSLALAAPTLTIQSAPSLAGDLPSGAISIAKTLAAAPEAQAASWQAAPEQIDFPPEEIPAEQSAYQQSAPEQSAPEQESPSEQTPAETPVQGPAAEEAQTVPASLAEIFERAQTALPQEETTPPGREFAEDSAALLPVGFVDFGPEKLSRTLRMIDKAELDGMLPHLFAIRAFFPENAVNASAEIEKSFRVANRTMQSTMDRLFVRLRIPRYSLTAKDLEDRDSRFALRQLVGALLSAKPLHGGDGRAAGVTRISGPIDTQSLRSLQPELESAPLGSPVSWQVAATMLGTTIYLENLQLPVMGVYRDALLEAFSTLRGLPLEEFHRVLRDSANRTLDDALNDVCQALRGAAPIAVD